MAIRVFRRVEQKYLITGRQYKKIIELSKNRLEKDIYFMSNICNIYFDTEDDYMVKKSLDKPIYKEKVRLRSYGVPKENDYVFLEIKNKYNGIVGKRRVMLKLKDFYEFYKVRKISEDSQIMKELEYYFNKYNLVPKKFIAYNRLSYKENNNDDFRLTFDYNARYRDEDLRLELGDSGKLLTSKDEYIMEAKSLDALPLWFTKILTDLKIYPVSYSKYGRVYMKGMIENV